MTSLECLLAARKLIENSCNWTQGAFARKGRFGVPHGFKSGADCWCAYGALAEAQESEEAMQGAVGYLRRKTLTLVEFNDTHTHAEVLALYDAAIELARENDKPEKEKVNERK